MRTPYHSNRKYMKRFGCTDEVPGVQKQMEETPPFTCQETATSEAWFLSQINYHCLKIIRNLIEAMLLVQFQNITKKCYFCPLLDLKVYRMLAEQVGAVSCKGENANLHVYTIHQMSETHFLSSFAPHDVLYCLYLWASNGYKPIKIRSFAPFFDETAHYSSTMPRK